MRYLFFLVIVICVGCNPEPHTFQISNGEFLYDGKPVKIYSGEMHYARVPKEYWRHRFQMMKAMGLNTVATYVFWNYHETAPGVWDFESGNKNLAAFIRTAQEEGLFVILRPGPYACAEWEFGGYPWWLQNNKDLVIRTNNKPFLDACRNYIHTLAEQVKDLQITKGGPIIMVQAENEFGSYVAQRKDIPIEEHKKYNQTITQYLAEAGFEVPLFTSDGSWFFDGGAVPGALPTANGEGDVQKLKEVVNQYHNNEGPYMVAEFYPGWLDHWAEPFVRVATEKIVEQTKTYLANNVHFNFYMVHGGTNFGFTSGANYNDQFDIQPDITSYDYDAPISEAGWATEKYMALREVMKASVPYDVPEIPDRIPVIQLPEISLSKSMDFFGWCKNQQAVTSATPLTFEELGQGHGYVVYSKVFTEPLKGVLTVSGLRDYGLVYVNGTFVGELNRIVKKYELEVDIPAGAQVDILVENMGRINYGANIVFNTKGIISPVTLNGMEVSGEWKMYKAPLTEPPAFQATPTPNNNTPTFYFGEFELTKAGDAFLDMRTWGKGIVFVNGHHLGRYWKVGPQQTLYVPGCWLKNGKNEVVIFEQRNEQPHSALKSVTQPILDEL